jgi:hypothetical protein
LARKLASGHGLLLKLCSGTAGNSVISWCRYLPSVNEVVYHNSSLSFAAAAVQLTSELTGTRKKQSCVRCSVHLARWWFYPCPTITVEHMTRNSAIGHFVRIGECACKPSAALGCRCILKRTAKHSSLKAFDRTYIVNGASILPFTVHQLSRRHRIFACSRHHVGMLDLR